MEDIHIKEGTETPREIKRGDNMGKHHRKFDGKWFTWIVSKGTKADAKRYAKWSRSNGWNARIIKGRDSRGKIIYRLYESDARSKRRGKKRWQY